MVKLNSYDSENKIILSFADEIIKLKWLVSQEVISQEEFEKIKSLLIEK